MLLFSIGDVGCDLHNCGDNLPNPCLNLPVQQSPHKTHRANTRQLVWSNGIFSIFSSKFYFPNLSSTSTQEPLANSSGYIVLSFHIFSPGQYFSLSLNQHTRILSLKYLFLLGGGVGGKVFCIIWVTLFSSHFCHNQ